MKSNSGFAVNVQKSAVATSYPTPDCRGKTTESMRHAPDVAKATV